MRGFVIVFFFFLLRIDKITESFDVFFRRVSRFRQQFPRSLHMSWSFSIDEANKQKDSLQGKDGEYYFVPGTKPKWSGPQKLVGRSKTLPLFPRNSVLLPEGVEYLTIYDIRFRQMLNDVEVGGYFGCVYVSPEYSKYGLVGTVARVNHIERLDDGAMYIKITGEKRFFIREISQDRPYPISKVQYLFDGLDNAQQTRQLERKLFHQLRHSMKLLKRLYPDNNYTLSDTVYRNRPYFAAIDTKTTRHTPTPIFDPNVDSIQRQASFSYGVMNLLKTDAVTRLLVLQESILDQRLQRLCKVLHESNKYLAGEVKKRFGLTDEALREMRTEHLFDMGDFLEYEKQQMAASRASTLSNEENINRSKEEGGEDSWHVNMTPVMMQ